MTKTKCIGLAVLVVFLTALVAVGAAGAATEEGTATVTVDTSALGAVTAGSTVTVPVYLEFDAARNLGAFKFDVEIDGEYITVEVPGPMGQPLPMALSGTYTNSGNQASWYCLSPTPISSKTHIVNFNVTISETKKRADNKVYLNLTNVKVSGLAGAVTTDGYTINLVNGELTVNYPPSVPASVDITAPTDSLAYKATGTAAATVIDQYGEVMSSPSLTWSSSNTDALTIDAATGEYEVLGCAAGTVDITATTSNSKSDKVTVSLTKATPKKDDFEISGNEDVVYDGKTHNVTAAPKSGIEGMGDITILYNGSVTEPSALGSYSITLNVAEGDNYIAAAGLETGKQLNITKAVPTKELLSYDLTAVDYDGAAKPVSVKAKDGVTGLGTITVKYNGDTAVPAAAGTYKVTVDIAEGDNYRDVTDLSLGDFVINKIALQVSDFTVNPSLPKEVTYDGTDHPVTVTVKDGIYGNGTLTVLYDGGNTVPKNAAAYAVTVTAAEGLNYTATSSPIALGTLTITAKQMTDAGISITAEPSEFTYDGTAKTPGITVKDGAETLVKDTDYTITNESATNAGTYVVDVTGKGNYAGTNSSVSWTIKKAVPTKADFTVTPAIADVQYDGKEHTFTINSANITDGTKTVSYSSNGAAVTAPIDYGTYLVNVSVSGAANYEDALDINLGQFNITKTWPTADNFTCRLPSDLTYNTSKKEATVEAKVDELKNNFTVMYYKNGAVASPVAAGTYTVNVSVTETTNYAAKELTVGTFTIAQKSIADASVTLNSTAFTYDGTEKSISVTKVNLTDTWELTAADYNVTGTTKASAAGTYTVTVTGKDNYTGSKDAQWTISKAVPTAANFTASNSTGPVTFPLELDFNNTEQTVNVEPAAGVYGMGTITVTYKNVTSGLEEKPKKVGSYNVNISVAKGDNFTAVSDLHLGVININSKEYTITYETNGGTAIDSETYNSGKDTKELNTTTTKPGYHLDGWYANAEFTGAKVTQITAEDFGDKTFYAKWLNNTYSVHFDANNTAATGTMNDQPFTYDAAAVELTANAFTLAGYHFVNWSTANDGSGTLYADKQAVRNLNETDGGVTTLYAVWEPNTYTVHFDGNRNTSGSMTDQQFTYDKSQALTANAFTRTGYIFENWATKADGTGTLYTDQQIVQNLTTENGGTVTLYAKWKANETPQQFNNESDTITLGSDYVVSKLNVSGTNITAIAFVYDQSVEAPTRPGYHDHKKFGDAFNITLVSGEFDGGKVKIYFNISKADLGTLNPANVWLAHLKDGGWEFLPTVKESEDNVNIMFSAETTSFSPFYPMYMVQNSEPTPSHSSSSSRNDGYSVWLQPTAEPTPVPTQAAEPTPGTPSVSPINQPPAQTSTPAPFIGIIAGLGAAGLLFTLRRK